jgi:adenylate cyclase
MDDGMMCATMSTQRPGPRAPDEDRPSQSGLDAFWRALLNGDDSLSRQLRWQRRLFKSLPSNPRCKLCYAPKGAPFGPVVGLAGFGGWAKNPTLCNNCMNQLEHGHGGAEIRLSLLFADIRGSTELAARISAVEYSRLLSGYYAIAAEAIQEDGGTVDKYLGDGVFALFIPAFAGEDHAAKAVEAARRILAETATSSRIPADARPLPVGIGVHTGDAFVGIVGEREQKLDFTALGDAVNLTARLSSVAEAGEVIYSDETVRAAGVDTARLVSRELDDLKGIGRPIAAWSEQRADLATARV